MVESRKKSTGPARPLARTPEAAERQLVGLAMEEAKRQLEAGTASPGVITHFLKIGATQAVLEKRKLEHEIQLLKARTEGIESASRMEELYEGAIKAMKAYTPNSSSGEDYED